jgi:hypothetical protein
MSAPDPELDVAATAMAGEDARFVVIGGFAVIANRFVRATEDIDFLVPDDEANDRRVLAALLRLGGDLLGLAEIHGELPEDEIPGLDT